MSKTRTVEISITQIIAVVVVLVLIGVAVVAFVTRDAWLQLFTSEVTETEEMVAPASPTSVDPAADLAEKVALAYYTIDYRDQEGWLKQFEPFATETAFELLRTVFAPMSFSLFEKDELIITAEQITVDDQGILKQGDTWQIRLVDVHIDDPPETMPSGDLEMRLLLVKEIGAWKYQAILTVEEVESFQVGG